MAMDADIMNHRLADMAERPPEERRQLLSALHDIVLSE
jgi:hypothetical protein